MPTDSLLQRLDRRPLLCDGAMGTQLIEAGLAPGSCGEGWNVERPDAIRAIHQRYRDAGADLLTTNTFGGTAATLSRHGLADQAAAINRAGAALAVQAAGSSCFVLGDMGPFGDFLEPVGTATPAEVLALFTAQARALKEGGAHAIIVETMVDPAEMALAVEAARTVADWPVIATYAFGQPGGQFRTIMGSTVEQCIRSAIDAGASIVGANCGTNLSLEAYLSLARELVAAAGKTPVILQPNAGAPRTEEGKLIYDAAPAAFAALVPQLLQAGVRIVGGCCGTTPEHIRAAADALRNAR